MRVSPQPHFGRFSSAQQLVLKHVKTSDAELLNTYGKVARGKRDGLSAQEVNAIRAALKMRLETTRNADFLRQLEQMLSELPGSSVEAELFETFARACARVYGGPYGNL